MKQSKDLKNDMSPIVENFLSRMKKIVQDMSKRHHRQKCVVMRAEKDREEQAVALVNQYYDMLSSRDIRQDWFSKSPVKSEREIQDIKPTVWPFLDTPKTGTPSFMKRRSGFYKPNTRQTLEPTVRVFEESRL